MSKFISKAVALVSRHIPEGLKDRLLAIQMVRNIRNVIYKGTGLAPYKIPNLPWPLYLYLNLEHPGERLFITRNHEPHVVRWLLDTVKPGWIVFDVGAFIGFYTILLGQLCGAKGCVIAFEPIEALKEQILLSCRKNNLENVFVETMAVGAKCGEVEFWIHEDPTGGLGTSSSIYRSAGKRRTMVTMITIDQYVKANALPRVDLIKVDVEGAEMDVLAGAQDTLSRFKPKILIEFNNAEDRERAERFLRDLGYTPQELGRSSYGVHIVAAKGGVTA